MGLFEGVSGGGVLEAADRWLGTMPTDKQRLALLRKLGKLLEPKDDLEIPETLRTPEFLEQWDAFCAYRTQRKASTRKAYLTGLLRRLVPYGPQTALQSLRESEEQDWLGVFPEKINNGHSSDQIRDRDWA